MSPTAVREISLHTVWQLARPTSLSLTAVAGVLGFSSAAGCGYALEGAGAVATLLLACGWLVGGVWMLYHPQQALWGLVSLPVSLVATGWMWFAPQQQPRAPWAWRLTVAAALVHGLSMAGGLLTVTLF